MEQNKQIKIGEWFCAIEGIAIAERIHVFYYEEYEEIPEEKKVGDYKYSMVEYKLFCDFDGTPIKRNRHKIFREDWCSPIDNKYQKVLNKSIKDYPKEYASFLKLLKTTKEFKACKRLIYELSPNNKEIIIQGIETIKNNLPSKFSFQDILNIAKENKCALDLTKFESSTYFLDLYLEILLVYTYGNFNDKRVVFNKFVYEIHGKEV